MAETVVLFDTFDGPAGPLTDHVPNTVLGGEPWFGFSPFSMLGNGTVRDLVASFPYGRSSIGALFPGLSAPAVLEFTFVWGLSPSGGEMQFQVVVNLYDENDDLIDSVGIRLRRASSYASFDIVQNSGFSFGSVTAEPGMHLARLNIEAGGQLQAYLDDVLIVSAAFNPNLSLPPTSCVVSFAPNDGRPVNNRFTFYEIKLTASGDAPQPPSGKNLYKLKTVSYTPGQQGAAPSPGLPARTVYETRQVCKFVPVASIPGAGGGGTDLGGGGTGTGGLSTNYIWVCSPQQVMVTYPAVPATAGTPHREPSTNIDYHLGWNAGARSVGFFTQDGSGQFQVRASVVGVICGLNGTDAVDDGYSGRNIDFAFSLARGVARIVENGVFVASAGAYTDDTVFKIERVGTAVSYSMGGEVVHTTGGATDAPLWLEAALYAGDDEVFAPSIVQGSPPDLTGQTGSINARLPALGVFASATPYAELRGVLPPLGGRLEAGLSAPAYAVGNFVLPPLFSTSTSLTGGVGQIDASLPALDMLAADHAYAELRGVLPPLDGVLYAVEGNENASMGSSAAAAGQLSPLVFLVAEMTSSGLITSAFLAEIVVPAEMLSAVELAGTFEFTSLMEAVMRSRAVAGGLVAIPGADTETFAFNVDSGGSTSYTGFGFNSYAQLGGRFYGANERGIFALEGDTDEGAPIRACINLGKLDFGSSTKKTISECFIGMSAAGNLFVKVLAEGRTFIYKTQAFSEQIQQQRVKFGMGLRTNYVEFEIYNEDGADFEIDTVEFSVADLSRKL